TDPPIAGSQMRRNRRPAVEDVRGRPSRAAVSGLARAPRDGMAVATVVLGLAQSPDHQPRRARGKMRRRGSLPAARCCAFSLPLNGELRLRYAVAISLRRSPMNCNSANTAT